MTNAPKNSPLSISKQQKYEAPADRPPPPPPPPPKRVVIEGVFVGCESCLKCRSCKCKS